MTRAGKSLVVTLFALLGAACSQILSIEEAYVDPTLSGSTVRAQSGAAGADPTSNEPLEHRGGSDGSGGSDPHVGGAGGETAMSSAGSGATTPVEPPPAGSNLCERYCDQVMRVCKGKYEQYRSFDQCIEVCKRLPQGQEDDDGTNTVGCRLRMALEATNEAFSYCKQAGPLGEGRCGSNCISYCSLMQATCTPESTGDNLEPSYYGSAQDCLSACAEVPTDTGPTYYTSSAMVEPTSFIGNTVFCRTYHLASALEHDTPTEHCPHAMGGDPCID